MSALTGRVLDGLGSGMVTAAGPLLPALVDALTGPLALVDELLTTPPGALAPPVVDLTTSPYPRVLAQVAGVTVPGAYDTEQARAYITGAGASRRGTAGAITAAVAATLTGSRRVVLLERDGSPWRVRFVTFAAETPDPAATLAAALTEKPVGLVLDHVLSPGVTWAELDDVDITWADAQTYTWEQLGALVPSP